MPYSIQMINARSRPVTLLNAAASLTSGAITAYTETDIDCEVNPMENATDKTAEAAPQDPSGMTYAAFLKENPDILLSTKNIFLSILLV